jgi:hypothetical protein
VPIIVRPAKPVEYLILVCRWVTILDFIRNNTSYHILSFRFRYRTRRLCNPHAMSMNRSATSFFVLRSTSFTLRERFTPAKACSTRTRTREMLRFVRFSAAVSVP